MQRISIAIDGPAGAGKSTVAKKLSAVLKMSYVDTGAMYRAVALKAIKLGLDTTDKKVIEELVKNIDIKVEYQDRVQIIYLDGNDVSEEIRTPEVSVGASNVAVFSEVRKKLVEIQRELAKCFSVVMDGRDIGTYVLPNANYKFFLTATKEERAKRRFIELTEKGYKDISYEQILKDIAYRDENDSSREFAPLSKAEDAILIDTTFLSINDVIDCMLSYITK